MVTMTDSDGPAPITDATIEDIAAEALSHTRTVERRLLRLPVKGKVAERVDAALVRRGLIRSDCTAPTSGRDGASR